MTAQEYIRLLRAWHQLDLARMQYETLVRVHGLDPRGPLHWDDDAQTVTPFESLEPSQVTE